MKGISSWVWSWTIQTKGSDLPGEELSQDIDHLRCSGIVQDRTQEEIPFIQHPSFLQGQDQSLQFLLSPGLHLDHQCLGTILVTMSNTFAHASVMLKKIQTKSCIEDGCLTQISVQSGSMTKHQDTSPTVKTFLSLESRDMKMSFTQ